MLAPVSPDSVLVKFPITLKYTPASIPLSLLKILHRYLSSLTSLPSITVNYMSVF